MDRKIGEGHHGVVHAAEIRFGRGQKKIVAARRYKTAEEAAGELATLRIDTLDSRPFVTAHNVFFRLKVGDPRSEAKVERLREMIEKLSSGGCAIAKMDFVEYNGEYWLVSPAFTRGGKSIVGEDYDRTNREERKIVWRNVGKMINAGFYTRDVEDSYFFYPTKYGKRPVIMDLDQIRNTDRKGDFFRKVFDQINRPAEERVTLARSLYSQLNPRNRKLFLRFAPDDIFEEITGRKRTRLTTKKEIELWERRQAKINKRKTY